MDKHIYRIFGYQLDYTDFKYFTTLEKAIEWMRKHCPYNCTFYVNTPESKETYKVPLHLSMVNDLGYPLVNDLDYPFQDGPHVQCGWHPCGRSDMGVDCQIRAFFTECVID